MLLIALLLTSCSFTEFLNPSESILDSSIGAEGAIPDSLGTTDKSLNDGELSEAPNNNNTNELDVADSNDSQDQPVFNNAESSQCTIDLTVTPSEGESDTNSPSQDISEKQPNTENIQMEIQLFFADSALVDEGKLGSYGFVTPVVRKVPATSGILKVALDELIKGPLPEEEGKLGPVIPATAKVNGAIIEDRVAIIDFNKALITDHSGGTLGGSITMQALVFTASQFESIDGVLVTVEGQPWDDGHFIWDASIYEEDLLGSILNNQ